MSNPHSRQRSILVFFGVLFGLTLILAACDLQGGPGQPSTNTPKSARATNTPRPARATNTSRPANTNQPAANTQEPTSSDPTATRDAGNSGNAGYQPVTICHATGSETTPYVVITIDNQGEMNGHTPEHPDDIIPAPSGGCPEGTDKTPTPQERISLCHATSSVTNPYVFITVSYNAVDGHGHEDHDDIIPATSADDCPGGPEKEKITICHATGSATNPYVEITVSYHAVDGHGHEDHADDIIPAPAGGCTPDDPPDEEISLCHATGSASNPYEEITISYKAADGHGHESHTDDISPIPADGCPDGPPPDIEVEPTVSVCVDFLIYHTFRNGDLEIYKLIGVEGQDDAILLNLSYGPDSEDSRPSRSLNDAWIVFESNRDGNIELYLADTKGISVTRLTNTSANNINPMFLADNETVVFQSDRNGNWDIFSININTGNEIQLTTNSNDDVFPFASPDPNWITFQSNRFGNDNLFLLNVTTGEEFQLTFGSSNEIFPAWSPNGEQIAFLSDEDGKWALYVVDINGENTTLVAGDANVNVGNHSWSPEGLRIAYQSVQGNNVDVYTYDFRDGEYYQLTDFAGADSSPSWNCGGEYVSFTTTRDGNPNVYQVYWQGGDQTYLTNHPATDKWSEWSPSKEQGSRGR